uniref:Uncharacterized protein n=1 Tax=Ananas comosus var. bracteatus TaxID=296719 RepID=A0A6V7QM96_ANACO|nr:unnamed protein product [Ananas comosus var. bracteatus]
MALRSSCPPINLSPTPLPSPSPSPPLAAAAAFSPSAPSAPPPPPPAPASSPAAPSPSPSASSSALSVYHHHHHHHHSLPSVNPHHPFPPSKPLFSISNAVMLLSCCSAVEYMRLPASQYSVLDAERIERVDDRTFRCYVYRIKFFAFEVCPVLLVRVDEHPFGCCITLLSCKVTIEIPFAFRAIPVEVIESTGRQVLEQLLRIMLPRFLKQLVKDYQAWASGDTSRQPLGTGEI